MWGCVCVCVCGYGCVCKVMCVVCVGVRICIIPNRNLFAQISMFRPMVRVDQRALDNTGYSRAYMYVKYSSFSHAHFL